MSGQRLHDYMKSLVLHELERWANGELGSKLTWDALEKISGVSRQALNAHPDIKSAYLTAKKALREGDFKTSRAKNGERIQFLERKVRSLEAVIVDYTEREEQWQKRWQRIAFHLQQKGFAMTDLDRSDRPPTQRETAQILRPFDKPLDHGGRD